MTAASAPACEPIVALDYADAASAMEMVDCLRGHCRFFKIGHELFTAGGPRIVERVQAGGNEVFLDLKFHDIPNTVRGGVRSAAALGVRLVTVHAVGGQAMLEAAVEGAGEDCGVLAVTVLTSLSAADVASAWGRDRLDVRSEVLRLADTAAAAGVHGLVCSGEEAAAVRDRFGGRLATLVPGIRLVGGATHDQARVVTPEAAVAAGARYIVVGRAVTAAGDPVAAYAQIASAVGHRA
ncbi:MAG TPA: orotidine-5'-phosphate decarboxylase [Gemmatimonadaceae bacterium]|nr:orotidine-5'-phosphate decarboxylase [Gemmatimonadaceae bacterium]